MLSDDEKEQMTILLAAAMQKSGGPPIAPKAATTNERLASADVLRRWLYVFAAGVLIAGGHLAMTTQHEERLDKIEDIIVGMERFSKLESKVKEIRPIVRQLKWQRDIGKTNAELQKEGIRPPDFPED